jgi:L-lactate dehydrogenase complex protein LldG
MTTRAEFMTRVRAETRRATGLFPAVAAARPDRPAETADIIRRELAERWPQTLARFREEFGRVGGVFYRVATVADVPDVVLSIARAGDARSLVAWPPRALGADLGPALRARGLECHVAPEADADAERRRARDLAAAADLGLTGVDLAIAETGTIVLRSGAGRPRATSLLPPCHVALFGRTALIESLAQLGVFLEAWHAGDPAAGHGASISLITGPSRTADIELTLTRGVHGPKEVHAIFVDEGLAPGG